jgi:Holliday junction resolvasome RuvABC DNA-binding subunit
MKQPFRVTIEHYDLKVTIETDHSDLDIHEAAELVASALIAIGYSKESVKKVINV